MSSQSDSRKSGQDANKLIIEIQHFLRSQRRSLLQEIPTVEKMKFLLHDAVCKVKGVSYVP